MKNLHTVKRDAIKIKSLSIGALSCVINNYRINMIAQLYTATRTGAERGSTDDESKREERSPRTIRPDGLWLIESFDIWFYLKRDIRTLLRESSDGVVEASGSCMML